MIDWSILILGFFLLAVTIYTEKKRKDTADEKDEEYETFGNNDYVFFIALFGILAVLPGLGLAFSPIMRTVPTWSFLIPVFVGLQAVRSAKSDSGRGTTFALIGAVAILFYVLLGSYY